MGNSDTKDTVTLQNSTDLYKNENPYDALNERHQKAVELRLNGVKCNDIARQLKEKEQTVRWWLSRNGPCYKALIYLKKVRRKEKKELFNQIEERLKDIAIDAVIVLENAVRKGNLKGALKVLEIVGFQAVQQFMDVTPKNDGIKLLEKILIENERNNRSVSPTQQADSPVPAAGEDL